jgi:hypothetical protein
LLQQKQVLELLLLGKAYWFLSLHLPCNRLPNAAASKNHYLHLIMQYLSLHLHLQRYLQPLLSSAAVERCSKL